MEDISEFDGVSNYVEERMCDSRLSYFVARILLFFRPLVFLQSLPSLLLLVLLIYPPRQQLFLRVKSTNNGLGAALFCNVVTHFKKLVWLHFTEDLQTKISSLHWQIFFFFFTSDTVKMKNSVLDQQYV